MTSKSLIALTVCGLLLAGCVTPSGPDAERVHDVMKSSFKSRGQAGVDRLDQDEVQAACSQYHNKLPRELAERITQAQLVTIQYPARLMGDWRAGERIAQNGRGKQFTDDPAGPVGGNCYACHQLAPRELAFGNIGPSLYQYGKLRGAGEAVQRATYGRIFNPEAFNACSNMPRFGHNRVLTAEQIADLVALLLSPESPVNQ